MSRDKPAKTKPKPEQAGAEALPEEMSDRPDWGDEAAQARTADDPRRVAPHDRTGRPSTGEPI
jgi:hypothetical protein